MSEPITHTSSFRVRFYECDAYGHVNNANYLRYMQEAAFDAAAAAGLSLEQHQDMGRIWLPHETEIEYLKPAKYNQVVEVKTWVEDMRRVTSRRRYELTLADSGEAVARGYTDWAFIDTQTGAPARIPAKMAAAFFTGDPPAESLRQPFPVAPPPPAGVFKMSRAVEWIDLDERQHVNNAVYLDYTMECTAQVSAAHGWSLERIAAAGFIVLLRRNRIKYLQPALYGDMLELATWFSDVKRSSATRYYTIRRARDQALLAEVHSLAVWVELASGRLMRIPQEFMSDFAPNRTAR